MQADVLQAEYLVRRYVICMVYACDVFRLGQSYRYSELLPFTSPTELMKLGEEFVQYQLLPKEEIPCFFLGGSLSEIRWK